MLLFCQRNKKHLPLLLQKGKGLLVTEVRRTVFLFPAGLHVSCVTLQLPRTSVSHFLCCIINILVKQGRYSAHRNYLQLFIHMVPEKSRVSFNDLMRSGVMARGSLPVLQGICHFLFQWHLAGCFWRSVFPALWGATKIQSWEEVSKLPCSNGRWMKEIASKPLKLTGSFTSQVSFLGLLPIHPSAFFWRQRNILPLCLI